jgi:hypothetical protein
MVGKMEQEGVYVSITPTLISYLEYLALILLCVSGAGPVVYHLKLIVGQAGQEGVYLPYSDLLS